MGKAKRNMHTGDDFEKVARDEEFRISAANLILGLNPFVPKHNKRPTRHEDKPGSETGPAADSNPESSGKSTDTDEKSSEGQSTTSEESANAETAAAVKSSEELSSAAESSGAETSTSDQAAEDTSSGKSEQSVSFAEEKSQTDESTQTSSADDSTNGSKGESAEKKPTDTQPGKWTESDDAMIVGMKEDNATWAVIGNAIGRGKNEAKKRYHEIKVAKANAAAEHSGGKESTHEQKPKEPVKSDRREIPKDASDKDTKDPKNKHNHQQENYNKTGSTPKSAGSTTSASLSAMEAALLASPASSATSSDGAGYDADDYDPYSPNPRTDPIAHERERRRQDRFMQRHLWAALYPRRGTAEAEDFADRGFSRRDRRLLAELEDRRIGNRWLEMQANFFNATGRMLPLHLIKAKLEGQSPTEEEQMLPRVARFEQMVASWNSSVADSEELLDPALAGEIPEDAMR
ncbi:hypothetical protein ACHAQH_001195 [Verticillium albo-atrum]